MRLYLVLVRVRLRAQASYRTSLVLDVGASLGIALLDVLAIFVVFSNTSSLNEWSLSEVALLYGVSASAFSVAEVAVGQLSQLPRLIRTGSFDLLLIRPVGSLFQLVTLDFEIEHLGRLVAGASMLAYGCARAPVDWTVGDALTLALAVAAGAVIFAAVWVIVSAIVFWTVDGHETTTAVTYGGHVFTQFPLSIYPAALRIVFTVIAPLAFVAHVPVAAVTGNDAPVGPWATPLVALLAGAVALAVWRFCERCYRSAGG